MRGVAPVILVSGGSGFVGRLITSQLLQAGAERVVLPVRERHQAETLRGALAAELAACGADEALAGRALYLPLPETPALPALAPRLRALGVAEIVHAAASLDYFDEEAAQAGNIDLTAALLALGRQVGIRRFLYISTAFSAGAAEGPVAEALHAPPARDFTVYTRTKRAAEHLVAGSGLPYLILRPSILIGHSCTGRYTGRAYGVYQIWLALHRLLTADYQRDVHLLTPASGRPALLHHDAFEAAFIAAYHHLEDGAICHITSAEAALPTYRELWRQWLEEVSRPRRAYLHEDLSSMPSGDGSAVHRLVAEAASVNTEIGMRHFDFERRNLERLKQAGMAFADTSADSVRGCLHAFVARSARIQRYRQRFGPLLADRVEYIDVPFTRETAG